MLDLEFGDSGIAHALCWLYLSWVSAWLCLYWCINSVIYLDLSASVVLNSVEGQLVVKAEFMTIWKVSKKVGEKGICLDKTLESIGLP